MINLCKYVLAGFVVSCTVAAWSADNDHWVATWGATVQGAPPQTVTVKNQTVRHKLEISVGGARLRIHLSNEYGSKPLIIGAASVAIANADGSVKPGSFAKHTFGGSPRVIVPPETRMISDPIE